MAARNPRWYDVVVERDQDGCYIASVPVLPGCLTQVRSLDELMERIKEAIELCLAQKILRDCDLTAEAVDALL